MDMNIWERMLLNQNIIIQNILKCLIQIPLFLSPRKYTNVVASINFDGY